MKKNISKETKQGWKYYLLMRAMLHMSRSQRESDGNLIGYRDASTDNYLDSIKISYKLDNIPCPGWYLNSIFIYFFPTNCWNSQSNGVTVIMRGFFSMCFLIYFFLLLDISIMIRIQYDACCPQGDVTKSFAGVITRVSCHFNSCSLCNPSIHLYIII